MTATVDTARSNAWSASVHLSQPSAAGAVFGIDAVADTGAGAASRAHALTHADSCHSFDCGSSF